ncbi:MAG: DUF2997 domain-containing protein [Methanomicrobiales archaeon]|nr:DUF2997 domain-containing protein [Methanomicrobiales archaeon]
MQQIEIRVDRDGNVTVHVEGVKGEECIRITRTLEEALGSVTDRSFRAEFFEEQVLERTAEKVTKL